MKGLSNILSIDIGGTTWILVYFTNEDYYYNGHDSGGPQECQ